MSAVTLLQACALIAIPSIALFAAVYYFSNKWAEIQKEKLDAEKVAKSLTQNRPIQESNEFKKQFFPLQVDAYQRLVLFLERIAPNNMIMRLNNPGLPAIAFQQKLLDSIRQEYEHNLAQQIFVSSEGWHRVRQSKEEVVKIINMAATKLEPTALATDLSRSVFEITAQLENQPTDKAIAFLKAELDRLV